MSRRTRISISIREDVLERIDKLADNIGISRNAWIVQVLGNQAMVSNKMEQALDSAELLKLLERELME